MIWFAVTQRKELVSKTKLYREARKASRSTMILALVAANHIYINNNYEKELSFFIILWAAYIVRNFDVDKIVQKYELLFLHDYNFYM